MMFSVVLTLTHLRNTPAVRDSEDGAQISSLVDQLEKQHAAVLNRLQAVGQRIQDALEQGEDRVSGRTEDVAGEVGAVVRLLPNRGGGGHDDGMSDLERRVAAIETKIAALDQKVDGLMAGAKETQAGLKYLVK